MNPKLKSRLPADVQIPYAVPTAAAQFKMRLDRNESLFDFGDPLAIGSTCDIVELCRRYPSPRQLQNLIADRLSVDPRQVLLTAGGDDALMRACWAFLAPGKQLLSTSPTFEMLPRYARVAGADWFSIPHLSGPYPIESVLSGLSPSVGVIAVVSPNNPTGSVIDVDSLRRLGESMPAALLLVDLAYTEFADQDLTPLVLTMPNAVAIRTFSKAWGMAGLRVGYAVGSADVIQSLHCAGNPYPVSGISAAMVAHRFEHGGELMRQSTAQVARERDDLSARWQSFGYRPVPSQANFVFVPTPRAREIWRRLAAVGIAVRLFEELPDVGHALRITCPANSKQSQFLLNALTEILEELNNEP